MEEYLDNPDRSEAENRAAIKRLLGLRDFPPRAPEEKRALLGSDQRVKAFEAIKTESQFPKRHSETKRGIVLEILQKKLISQEILRARPLIYIGSGSDIEYPLALGGRVVSMVDPVFINPDAQKTIIEKIKSLTGIDPIVEDRKISFKFDFGNGPEDVSVTLIQKAYPYSEKTRQTGDVAIPNGTGMIVLYASQDKDGRVQVDDLIRGKLAEGGIVLSGSQLTTKEGLTLELGS